MGPPPNPPSSSEAEETVGIFTVAERLRTMPENQEVAPPPVDAAVEEEDEEREDGDDRFITDQIQIVIINFIFFILIF